jgi:hypothetical protein
MRMKSVSCLLCSIVGCFKLELKISVPPSPAIFFNFYCLTRSSPPFSSNTHTDTHTRTHTRTSLPLSLSSPPQEQDIVYSPLKFYTLRIHNRHYGYLRFVADSQGGIYITPQSTCPSIELTRLQMMEKSLVDSDSEVADIMVCIPDNSIHLQVLKNSPET